MLTVRVFVCYCSPLWPAFMSPLLLTRAEAAPPRAGRCWGGAWATASQWGHSSGCRMCSYENLSGTRYICI